MADVARFATKFLTLRLNTPSDPVFCKGRGSMGSGFPYPYSPTFREHFSEAHGSKHRGVEGGSGRSNSLGCVSPHLAARYSHSRYRDM